LVCVNSGQRRSRESRKNYSRKPRDLLKNRLSKSLKKSQLTLSQEMLKKGDIVDDADNIDEVRIGAS
jgi:hypothetical protein